jgi:BolA family transcriptional regulator, general stress-responsive regulator
MTLKQRIEGKVKAVLDPQHMELVNESGNHNVPKGSETHFKLLLVTKAFSGKSLIERHRMVYALVDQELKEGLHALALQTYTPEEWLQYQPNRKSPPCAGGSKS